MFVGNNRRIFVQASVMSNKIRLLKFIPAIIDFSSCINYTMIPASLARQKVKRVARLIMFSRRLGVLYFHHFSLLPHQCLCSIRKVNQCLKNTAQLTSPQKRELKARKHLVVAGFCGSVWAS